MYSTHDEGNTVTVERFIKTLKTQIYNNITANDSKYYLSYLDKLVDQCNDTSHHCIGKKPINADYSALNKKIEKYPKATKFKVNDWVRITKYKKMS